MEIVLSDHISWQYCIIFLIFVIFLIWLFFGGQENLEYIGLSKLKIGVDAAKGGEHDVNSEENEDEEYVEKDEEDENKSFESFESFEFENEKIDKTPSLPDVLKKLRKDEGENDEIHFTHAKLEAPMISISESFECNKKDVPKSPKSLALGEFTCHKNEKISKGEMLCKKVIEDIYGVPFYCVRPDFLKNPETGRNLELDLYNDSLKIAVEYSGISHYKYPNYFHKTKDEFLKQVRRDQFKVEMCDKNGIYLITVPYTVKNDYDSIRKYIEYYLPENYEKRMKLN